MNNEWEWLSSPDPDYIMIVSGWATGPTFFSHLDFGVSIVVHVPFMPESSPENIQEWITRFGHLPRCVIGFSMGAGIVSEWRNRYRVSVPVVLWGASLAYSESVLDGVRSQLGRSVTGYLRGFWRAGLGDMSDLNWLNHVARQAEWPIDALLGGLNYLERMSLYGANSAPDFCPVIWMHGDRDIIVPASDAAIWAAEHGIPFSIIPEAGHLLMAPSSSATLLERINAFI
ncbi:hypothetical protein EBR96_04660 [bacterium]|nr:hypothetical protein [bacterium]